MNRGVSNKNIDANHCEKKMKNLDVKKHKSDFFE